VVQYASVYHWQLTTFAASRRVQDAFAVGVPPRTPLSGEEGAQECLTCSRPSASNFVPLGLGSAISWTGPTLGMFEMFGAADFRPMCKLQGDSRFDLSPDWLSFCHSLQCWPKNPKCCNQMRFASIQCSKMRLRPGLRPGPRWGSLQCSTDSLAGFKVAGGEGMEGEWREWERKRRRRAWREGK